MARLGNALFTYLTAQPALAALVGQRVYAQRLPQQPVLPAIVYAQVSRRAVHVKMGYIRPHVSVRMQFDVIALDYEVMVGVATALKTALYAFVSGGSPVVFKVMVENELDFVAPELKQVRRVVDALIWFHEEEG